MRPYKQGCISFMCLSFSTNSDCNVYAGRLFSDLTFLRFEKCHFSLDRLSFGHITDESIRLCYGSLHFSNQRRYIRLDSYKLVLK